MDKIDILDVYDINKNKTGKTVIRGKDELAEGEFFIGVQAIVINSQGEILISKRSPGKKLFPSMWECNGGAVLSGEDFLDALVREMKEELGLKLEQKSAIYLKSVKRASSFKEIYLFKKDVMIEELNYEDGEAVDAMWVDIEKFMDMLNAGEIVHNVNFDRLDYEKCLEILNLQSVVKGG